MFERIIGVFKLSSSTFEEIENDKSATIQAGLVVLVSAILASIGSALFSIFRHGSFFGILLSTLISLFVGWIVWAVVSWFVGTKFFGGKADIGEMLRVIGFSFAPHALGILPCIGGVVGGIWSIVAGFIAVRQGLDLDNTKTFFTIAIGVIPFLIIYFLLTYLIGKVI
jgi:hypothetical protein